MTGLRIMLLALFLAAACATSLGTEVVGTYPMPNTEQFTTADTLQIVFDFPPGAINGSNLMIQGRDECYTIGWYEVRANTAFVVPSRQWIVGDEIRVSVVPPLVGNAYIFSFTIAVPYGSDSPFQAGYDLTYAGIPMAMASADVDADGRPDLAILFNDHLGVARNLGGAGALFHPTELTWQDGGHPVCDVHRTLRAADMNNDGLPELISSDPSRNQLLIRHNTTSGGTISLSDTTLIQLPIIDPTDFQMADINGDGRLDIAVTGRAPDGGRLLVLRNLGNSGGQYQFASSSVTTGLIPTAVEVADVNLNNHAPELLIPCFGSKTVNLVTPTLFPFGLTVTTPLVNLPAGPDGIRVRNIEPYSDGAAGAPQWPDLLIWSQGLHLNGSHRGIRTLDEQPFMAKCRNLNSGDFGTPELLTLDAEFVPVTLASGDLDGASHVLDQDWVMVGHDLPSGDWEIWHNSDQMSGWVEAPQPNPMLTAPQGTLLLDLDLDGDLDYAFIEMAPGNEHIVYYHVFDLHPLPDAVDFGICPINGTIAMQPHPYVNHTPYSQTVDSVRLGDTTGVFGRYSSVTFPFEVGVEHELPDTFTFQPLVDQAYQTDATNYVHGYAPGDEPTLPLLGTGGRSIIHIDDHSGQPRQDTLSLGFCPPGGLLRDSIRISNTTSNYPLTALYISGGLAPFELCPAVNREVVPADNAGPWRTVCFAAPADTSDRIYTGCLAVYDSTFAGADWFGPRNPQIQDTMAVCFQVRVFVNHLPEIVCPSIALAEGDADTMRVDVYDPNDHPVTLPVRCSYDITSPTASLTITGGNISEGPHTQFLLTYRVDGDVPPAGEDCVLRFHLWDNQYPDSDIVRSCPLWITGMNDPPLVVVPHDTLVIRETAAVDTLLALLQDEEHDALDGASRWIGTPPSSGASVDFVAASSFRLRWHPDCEAAGLYAVELRGWEVASPGLVDRDTVWIRVLDTPANLAVTGLGADKSVVDLRTTISVNYHISELTDICPAGGFRTVLLHIRNAGLDTLINTVISDPVAPHGSMPFAQSVQLMECGTHEFRALVFPSGADSVAADNVASITVMVRCPDLSATQLTGPASVHKWNTFCLFGEIAEENNIAVDSSFHVRLFDGETMVWDSIFPSLCAGCTASLDSICLNTGVLGPHNYCLRISPPPGQDVNASNNDRCLSVQLVGDPFRAHPLPFTPNSDGFNDSLYFDFGDERYDSPTVNIFDVNGRLIVELREVFTKAIVWTGRDRFGSDCIPGAYFYTFTDGGKRVSSGLIYVAR